MNQLALKAGKLSGPSISSAEDRRLRDCKVARIDLVHPLVMTVLDRILEANNALWQFDLTRLQVAQFCVYQKDQHFDWHRDSQLEFLPRPAARTEVRKLTAILPLSHSSEYTGGNIEFRDESGVVYRSALLRTIGSVSIFPSHVLHRVTPIESGVRTCIVAWMLGPPFR